MAVEFGQSPEDIKTQIVQVAEVYEGMPGRLHGLDSDGFLVRTIVDTEGERRVISEAWIEVPEAIRNQARLRSGIYKPIEFSLALGPIDTYRQEVLLGISPGDTLAITSSQTRPLPDGWYFSIRVLPKEKLEEEHR